MPTIDEILQDLAEKNYEHANDLKSAYDASGLRKERDDYRSQAEAAMKEASELRGAVLQSTWQKVGAAGNPQLIQLPPDLDIRDEAAVREFAQQGGFAKAEPQVPVQEQQTYQRIAQAATDATPPTAPDAKQALRGATSEDDFWAKADQAGLTSNSAR